MRDVQVGQRREVFDSHPKRLQLDGGQRGDALICAPSWLVAFKLAMSVSHGHQQHASLWFVPPVNNGGIDCMKKECRRPARTTVGTARRSKNSPPSVPAVTAEV